MCKFGLWQWHLIAQKYFASRQVIRSPQKTVYPLLMADWVHCNLCFLQPKGVPFHITSCGHIYCGKCVVKGTKDNCKMCASKCSTMELTGNMKPDVEMYFQDPIDQLSKALKKCMQTWEFQRNHRRRLYTHLKGRVLEQNQMLIDAKKMVSSAQSLEREALKLKEENIYLKKLVQEKGVGSGPGPSPRSGCSPLQYRSSTNVSPGLRYSSQSNSHHGLSAPTHNAHKRLSGSSQISSTGTSQMHKSQITHSGITPDRIIARTPPFGGRMGTVGGGSPTAQMISLHQTPQSVPHQIYTPSFHGTPDMMAG